MKNIDWSKYYHISVKSAFIIFNNVITKLGWAMSFIVTCQWILGWLTSLIIPYIHQMRIGNLLSDTLSTHTRRGNIKCVMGSQCLNPYLNSRKDSHLHCGVLICTKVNIKLKHFSCQCPLKYQLKRVQWSVISKGSSEVSTHNGPLQYHPTGIQCSVNP